MTILAHNSEQCCFKGKLWFTSRVKINWIVIVFIFSANRLLCIWVYLLFPGFVLFEKMLQSFQSIARYFYIFCNQLMHLCCVSCIGITLLTLVLVFTSLPYLTIIDYYPTLYVTCEPRWTDEKPSNYQVTLPKLIK